MARLVISDGASHRVVELAEAPADVGRSPDCKIVIDDKQASRRHCQFEKTEHGYYKVVDLESRNGTRVNERQVNQALLRPGDRVVIGKFSLVFEDPQFKEPSAEFSAKFAPPTAPAPAALTAPPAASSAPLPVAQEVKPPPPALPEDRTELRTRRRSGHTTSIDKTSRAEIRREQDLIKKVAIGAGGFVALLLLLIMIPGGGENPAEKSARALFDQGSSLVRQQKYDEAIAVLSTIPAAQKKTHADAQALIRQVEEQQRRQGGSSEAERTEFDALYEFCEANRANVLMAEAMHARCEEFRKKYPRSPSTPKVEEYLKVAAEGRRVARRGDVADAERRAKDDLKRQDYASSLKKIKAILARYSDEVEVRERIVKFQDEVLDQAKSFVAAKRAEAADLKARSRGDEARAVLQALIVSMGDGTIPEFEDWCKIARNDLKAIP